MQYNITIALGQLFFVTDVITNWVISREWVGYIPLIKIARFLAFFYNFTRMVYKRVTTAS